MKTYSGVVTFILTAVTLGLRAETEEQIHRKFAVEPGTALVVDVGFGSIEVTAQLTNEIIVDVVRRVQFRKKSDEETFLKSQPVVITSRPGVLEVKSRPPANLERLWSNSGSTRIQAKYTVKVPVQCKVELRTSGGQVSVTGLEAPVHAQTSGGALKFMKLRGTLRGETSGGSVGANQCKGQISLRTSGGSVTVENAAGSLSATSSGGNMEVSNFNGPVVVRTSGGSIEISGVAGSLDARTSGGNVCAALNMLAGPVNLDTSGGTVELSLPSDAAADLDARASAGTVRTDLPVLVQGEAKRGELKGKINGGGQDITLRTSGGNIVLRSTKPGR